MCLACNPPVNLSSQEAFAERLLEILNHGATALLISIGHRTGLFDAMADGEARTSEELAEAAGLQERYVREWLAGMLVGRIVESSGEAGKYVLRDAGFTDIRIHRFPHDIQNAYYLITT